MSVLVTFTVAGLRFALRRAEIARILPAPRLTRPPAAPAALAGFFAYGPDIVTVLSFQALACEGSALGARLYDHVILLDFEGPAIALLVDRVDDVLEARESEERPVPKDATHRDSVIAEIETRAGAALLLDPARIIAEYEMERVRHFHDEERRRRELFGDAA